MPPTATPQRPPTAAQEAPPASDAGAPAPAADLAAKRHTSLPAGACPHCHRTATPGGVRVAVGR